MFIRYIGCTLLDALIVGVAAFIFLLAAQMPYAPLIAVVVAITNIIPTFGPMIGAAIGIFFLVLESPFKAFLFFVFICLLQSLDGKVYLLPTLPAKWANGSVTGLRAKGSVTVDLTWRGGKMVQAKITGHNPALTVKYGQTERTLDVNGTVVLDESLHTI